ncbi:MAG: prepilin peptidase [Lachnospiraceae bacterium]|nr:prepilin peptidase [Lachnospiraceae bacterium]
MAVILNAAMVSDILIGKIRNGLIIAGLVLGLIYQAQTAGLGGVRAFAGGVLLTLAAAMLLFAFGAIGAGDGKLLAVVGGFLGMAAVPGYLLLVFLFGAVQAVLKMLWQGSLIRRFRYFAEYMGRSLRTRQWTPYGQSLQEEEAVIHLSAAVLFAWLIGMIGGFL